MHSRHSLVTPEVEVVVLVELTGRARDAGLGAGVTTTSVRPAVGGCGFGGIGSLFTSSTTTGDGGCGGGCGASWSGTLFTVGKELPRAFS